MFGATAALELQQRGWRVTLVDPGPLPHPQASSTDVSKLIRMDYGSDTFYHELAESALRGWDRWNSEWPRPLYHQHGLLVLARGEMIQGGFEYESLRVLRERGYEPERLDRDEITRRFPTWGPVAHAEGYLNLRAGWAESGEVVTRLLAEGTQAGVTVRRETVTSLTFRGSAVSGVLTESGRIPSGRVLVCAGAWTPLLLPWLSGLLRVTAQPVLHFAPADPEPFRPSAFPPWTSDIANTGWYGFPALADGRVKVAHHGPGLTADPQAPGDVEPGHEVRARAFLREALPTLADAPVVFRRLCLYCDSSDGDFLISGAPERHGLFIAAGGSGHAFKFAPVLGPIIADVVEERASPWADRFRWRLPAGAACEEARFAGS